jgi:U3 small nucleolar RNA-associated protein 14
MESNSSSATLKSTDGTPVSPTAPRRDQPPLRVTPPPADAFTPTPAANPWLKARDETNSSRAIKRHEVVVSKNSAAPDKSKHKLRKQVLKTKGEQEKARADADLEISVDQVLVPTAVPSTSTSAKGKGKAKKQSAPGAADDDDDQGSEVEFQEQTMQHKGKKGAFQQRDLVAAAFADDNVVQVSSSQKPSRSSYSRGWQDFAQAKQREIQEDAPREIDMSLAGWVRFPACRLFRYQPFHHRGHGAGRGRRNRLPSHS